MTRRKRAVSLADGIARKHAAAPPPLAPGSSGGTKALTLRLPEATHDALAALALAEQRSPHALLLDALGLLLEKHGTPPVVPQG
jgi:hypothetical protein